MEEPPLLTSTQSTFVSTAFYKYFQYSPLHHWMVQNRIGTGRPHPYYYGWSIDGSTVGPYYAYKVRNLGRVGRRLRFCVV